MSSTSPAVVLAGDDLRAARRVCWQRIARAALVLDDLGEIDFLNVLHELADLHQALGEPDTPTALADLAVEWGQLDEAQAKILRRAARDELDDADEDPEPWGTPEVDDPHDVERANQVAQRRVDDARTVLAALDVVGVEDEGCAAASASSRPSPSSWRRGMGGAYSLRVQRAGRPSGRGR